MNPARAPLRVGTLAYDDLMALVTTGGIRASAPLLEGQVQPASLDLTLGTEAYRLPGSILPLSGERMEDLVRDLALESLDLSTPCCLAREQVYAVRLRESLELPPGLEGYTNTKSTAGRVDVGTRTIADGGTRYDRVPAGYRGPLWVELIPRSFNVVVRAGVSLNQAIFFTKRHVLNDDELGARYRESPLLLDDAGKPAPAEPHLFDGRVMMTANLGTEIVGFVAKRTHKPLKLFEVQTHDAQDFFIPVPRPRSGYLFLEKGNFYILATNERIWVPEDLACEMVPYDATAGEFRAHYAGFFDPGWGLIGKRVMGAHAVLEVRSHQDDLIMRHGQPICAMAFESLASPCTHLYGTRGNSYVDQVGPKLSKHFKDA